MAKLTMIRVYDQVDVDDEISRLEGRISDLEGDLERAEAEADSLSEELGAADDMISDLQREEATKEAFRVDP